MKKIMATAMGLMFTGVAASWALVGLEDVSYDGSLEVVGVSAKNEVDQDDSGATSDRKGGVNTRVMVGINAAVTEGVKGRVLFARTGSQYGNNFAGTRLSANNTIDNETANIAVLNAFVDIEDVIFGVGAILGRQFVGEAGDLVWNIAPTDNDLLAIGAIDGITLRRDWEYVNSNLFFGKFSEDDAQGNTNADDAGVGAGDINLNSFDLIFPTIIPGGKINAGYLWGNIENTSLSGDANKLTTFRVGVKGGVAEDRFTYRAEYLANGGEDKGNNVPPGQTKVSYEGNAIDLGVGYNSPETSVGTFNARLGLIAASGDDNAANGDDESFHDFTVIGAGTSDRIMGEIFGKSSTLAGASATTAGPGGGVDTGPQGQGMDVLNIGVTYTPPCLDGKLSGALDYWTFDTAEDGTTTGTPMADEYGNEIDLVLNWAHSDNVGIDLGYAMFSPGKAIVGTAAGAKDDDITKLFARAKISWGGEEE